MKTTMKHVLLFLCGILSISVSIHAQDQERQLGQPVLMALPTGINGMDPLTTFEKDKNAQAAATAINQVLAERQLEVRDLKQQMATTDRLRAKMEGVNTDPNALIAASMGADVYLEYTIDVVKEGPTNKVRVDINVKESATAKILGASTGLSDAIVTSDIGSLTQLAVNNCIERIMGQIRGYWSEVPTRGKPIILTISSPSMSINKPTANGKRIDREVTRLLKANTISYRKDYSTEQTMLFNPVYVDAFKYDDVTEFGWLIEDLMSGLGIQDYSLQVEGKSVELSLQ